MQKSVKRLWLLIAVCVLALALVAPFGLAQDPSAVPNASPAEGSMVNYIVDVADKIMQYHPEGKKHSKEDYINGAKNAVIKAIQMKPDMPDDQKATLVAFLKENKFRSYTQLIHVLDRYSRDYTKLNMEAVADAAANGALRVTQDQFCRVLTFQDIQKMQQMMQQGQDKSIGLVPMPVDPEAEVLRLKVGHVRRGYLAYDMGLREGDEILSINGVELGKIPREKINELMDAEAGTRFTITIKREGFAEALTLTGVQPKPEHPAARGTMLPGKIGYIDTNMFTMDLHTAVRAEIKKLQAQGMVALILDLRNNPGGAMPACTELADDFLEKGSLITTTKGSYVNPLGPLARMMGAGDDGEKVDADTTRYVDKRDNPFAFPLIVLINKQSASASEMLSGCWKAHKRAILVGETTYGKGIGQTAIPLSTSPTGASGGLGGMMMGGGRGMRFLYMTVMTYFAPDGSAVHHVGISPNVAVALSTPDAKVFDKVVALRNSGELEAYLEKNFAANAAFFEAQLASAPAAASAYPNIADVLASPRAKALSADTLGRELRAAIARRLTAAKALYDLADDNQLQTAILQACEQAKIDAAGVEAFKFFAK